MPKIGDIKKFKGKKHHILKYIHSEYMGKDIGWVDTFRDVESERTLEAYYKARADFEEKDFQRKMSLWNLEYKRLQE